MAILKMWRSLKMLLAKWHFVTLPGNSVFNPGGLPSVTYVARDHLGLERQLSSALNRRHSFIVISGPTKCGKSVLCRRALAGHRQHVLINGGQINQYDDFWRHLAHTLKIPTGRTDTSTNIKSSRWLGQGSFGVVSKGTLSYDRTRTTQDANALTYNSVLMLDVIAKLKAKNMALIIEDFHYIEKAWQQSIIRALKPAVFDGLQVIILAVPHHAFDPSDVEAEVEGRIDHVQVPRWSADDLLEIAEQGFRALNLTIPANVRRRICDDGFGNPLLVQELCLQLIEALDAAPEDRIDFGPSFVSNIYDRLLDRKGLRSFERLANSTTNERSPVMVDLKKGGEELLGVVLLSSVARNGPQPITTYPEIRDGFVALSRSNPPSTDLVGQTFSAMANTLSPRPSGAMEWIAGRHELALTDPFLMFYMRWVLRDRRRLNLEVSAIDTALAVQPKSIDVLG